MTKLNKAAEAEFSFSPENLKRANEVILHYPRKRSAVLPILHLAQEQEGWISEPIMLFVASFLAMEPIEVREIAAFYTMFNLKPMNKFHLQVCRTTPCWLRGSEEILKVCRSHCKKWPDLFSVSEVECLGACVAAPVVQINNATYFEKLDPDSLNALLNDLSNSNKS